MHPESLTVMEVQRKLEGSKYTFIGWAEDYKGKNTKCKIECLDHGVWESTSASNLVFGTSKLGCPKCVSQGIKERRLMNKNLRESQIQKSARDRGLEFLGFVGEYIGNKTRLKLSCRNHGQWETATISNFLRGSSCPSCNGHNQRQCYLNLVYDGNLPVAVKFGISQNFEVRLWAQNNKSPLHIINHSVYTFEESEDCKNAEREIKNSLVCGILDKSCFPDGYTETTYLNNINTILDIFEKYGGKSL